MSFGEVIKSRRIDMKKTLRQFCMEHGHDPSNWSKIERGINPPPKDETTLACWASQLGLSEKTNDWDDFMYQAAISKGLIPSVMLSDEALVKKLPAFLRTITNAELTENQLDDFIERVRQAHSPDKLS